MAYNLKAGIRPEYIEEYEYAKGPRIKFKSLNSCIGIIAKVRNKMEVIGIHLVMMDDDINDPKLFESTDVNKVMQILSLLDYEPAKVGMLGDLYSWSEQVPGANMLHEQLHPNSNYCSLNESGIYVASLSEEGDLIHQKVS